MVCYIEVDSGLHETASQLRPVAGPSSRNLESIVLTICVGTVSIGSDSDASVNHSSE